METLKQPKVRVTGARMTISSFEIVHAGKKRQVDGTDLDFGPGQPNYWFYVQVVRFKDVDDFGFHVSEGAQGTGPASSLETGELEFVATVASGNIGPDGSSISYHHQHVIPSSLMEVK